MHFNRKKVPSQVRDKILYRVRCVNTFCCMLAAPYGNNNTCFTEITFPKRIGRHREKGELYKKFTDTG